MTGVTRPRGPLPARVYWTRRLLVTVVALALVFGIARMLGGATGGGAPEASTVGGSPTGSVTTPAPTPTSPQPSGSAAGTPAATGGPLAQPTGPCVGSDVVTVPSVKKPSYAATPIIIETTLRTRTSPACTWTVSAASLVVKVTRPFTLRSGVKGTDSVWTTQDCRGAVPKQVVVLRRNAPVTVTVVWNGRRSDSSCSTAPTWAGTGFYHVAAAAFGGDPSQAGFRLGLAPRATITATPTPTPTATPRPTGSGTASPGRGPTASPGAGATPRATGAPRATPRVSGSPSASTTPSASASRSPAAR